MGFQYLHQDKTEEETCRGTPRHTFWEHCKYIILSFHHEGWLVMLIFIHTGIKLATDLHPKATISITLGKDFLDIL